jgi:hypothetical protein
MHWADVVKTFLIENEAYLEMLKLKESVTTPHDIF